MAPRPDGQLSFYPISKSFIIATSTLYITIAVITVVFFITLTTAVASIVTVITVIISTCSPSG